jgi:hypothetical protein
MQNSERPLKRHDGVPHPVATRYADLRSLRVSIYLSVLAGEAVRLDGRSWWSMTFGAPRKRFLVS